jgi:hypothetical protein
MAAIEVFADLGQTTVTAGGTTAPSPGTSESWTVASSASFPAVSTGVSQFHIRDPNLLAELMLVTNISGTTWTVTRGTGGTTPVSHASGFTIIEVVDAGTLTAFVQNPMSATGDTIYGGSSGAPQRLPGNTTTTKNFLTSTGTGSAGNAPAWGPIASGDVPDLAYVDSVSAGDSSVTVTGASDVPVISSVAAQLAQRILCV